MDMAFGMMYYNVSVIKEGGGDDLKMIKVYVNIIEGGNLPPTSSSIRDKIFRSQISIFFILRDCVYGA